jgi:hypothetical protein
MNMKKHNKAKLSYILLLASILGGTTACKRGNSSSSQGSELVMSKTFNK